MQHTSRDFPDPGGESQEELRAVVNEAIKSDSILVILRMDPKDPKHLFIDQQVKTLALQSGAAFFRIRDPLNQFREALPELEFSKQFPEAIVFRDGKEVGRQVGFMGL